MVFKAAPDFGMSLVTGIPPSDTTILWVMEALTFVLTSPLQTEVRSSKENELGLLFKTAPQSIEHGPLIILQP